jgi:hypothetical protein
LQRACRELLQQRIARLDEDQIELDVFGGVIAFLEPDMNRPVGLTGRADQPDGDCIV